MVLDVGAGTGGVGRAALRQLGSGGRVIGVDASVAMLQTHRPRVFPLAAALVPVLPFTNGQFDAVLVGFVLSHFADVRAALREFQRVSRPDGTFAASAWGSLSTDASQRWANVAAEFATRDALDREFRVVVPDEAAFANPDVMRRAIEDAGYREVRTHSQEYRIEMSTSEFLASREAGVQGTLLHRLLSPADWARFQERIATDFHRVFGPRLEYRRDAHFVVGRR